MPGGIGNHAYCLAKELSRNQYSVTVATEPREQNAGDWEKFLEANRELNIIGIRRRQIIFLTYFMRFLKVYKLVRTNVYKAVIYSGKFSVWMNAVMPKTKSIVVIHGSEIKQKGFAKFLFQRGLKRAAKIVCVSAYTKSQLLANYQEIEDGKVYIINNGIDDKWFNFQVIEKNQEFSVVNLITVGGIHKRKGQFNVVRALPDIITAFPRIRYHSVGIPLEKAQLLDLVRKLRIENHVSFHHGLNDEQVTDVLKDSHIFMMLSEHLSNGDFEGFGIAIIEAMALGLPAVGSKNSGIADAISDKYSGRLVDPQNPQEIVSALGDVIKNYQEYSENAKTWAENFKWQHKIKEYQNLFDLV